VEFSCTRCGAEVAHADLVPTREYGLICAECATTLKPAKWLHTAADIARQDQPQRALPSRPQADEALKRILAGNPLPGDIERALDEE
jgi:recombinational DNA repair protein (RecF pathway)